MKTTTYLFRVLPLIGVFTLPCVTPALAQSGAWNVRTTEIWDDESKSSYEKVVRVWDEQPEDEREWSWPNDHEATGGYNAEGSVNGYGQLIWRSKGTGEFDREAIIETYLGAMVDGKREGEGTLTLIDGTEYRGEWQGDVAQGNGVIRYSNGDVYTGRFEMWVPHGAGVAQSASGEKWKGEFRNGVPDGEGIATLLSGVEFASVWKDGRESIESVERRASLRADVPGSLPGLDMAITADPGKNVTFGITNYESVEYRSEFKDGTLMISPRSEVWTKWQTNGGVYDLSYWGSVAPIFLDLAMSNASREKATFKRGEVVIESSYPDLRPYLHFYSGDFIADKDFTFVLLNSGWGRVLNPRLRFNLTSTDQEYDWEKFTFEKQLEDFELGLKVDLEAEFVKMGASAAYIRENRTEMQSLVKLTNAKEVYGPFLLLKKDGSLGGAKARFGGLFVYDWIDHLGNRKTETARLSGDIDLYIYAEGGEGMSSSRVFDITFDIEKADYRIPFDYDFEIAPGESGRFGLNLGASRSSYHKFRIELETVDGERMTSPPCEAHCFIPRLVNYTPENGFEEFKP